jgi:hypothetical protein
LAADLERINLEMMSSFALYPPCFSLMSFFDAVSHTGPFNMGSIDKARKLNSRAKAQKRNRGIRI